MSRRFFLDFASGKFGQDIVRDFLNILLFAFKENVCKDLGPRPSRAMEVFSGVLFGMGDCWRRFVHQVDCYPWKLFELAVMSERDFLSRWSDVHKQLSKCPCCLDIELTRGLLAASPDPDDSAACKEFYVQVAQLLIDMATFTPLSTDAVEVLHGQLQNVIQKFRGRGKLARGCSERSVFHSLVTEHRRTLETLKAETLPNARLVSLINRPAPAHQSLERPLAKDVHRSFREICGWNVFLREGLQGEVLPKAEYARRERNLSRVWKQMSVEDKVPYHVRAKWETERRQSWSKAPLPVGDEKDKAPDEIGRRMVHKLNFIRLQVNYKNLREHPGWLAGLGLGDVDGALRSDLVETTLRDEDIASALDPVLKHVSGERQDSRQDAQTRRTSGCTGTCQIQRGLCQRSPLFSAVQNLVKGLARSVNSLGLRSGALLQFWAHGSHPGADDCVTAFLAATILRPSEHVLVYGSMLPDCRARMPLLPSTGLPELVTSHKLFETLLSRHAAAGDTEACKRLKVYTRQLDFSLDTFSPGDESHTFLEVTVLSEKCAPFALNDGNKRKQAKPKLPFGLQKIETKRKQLLKTEGATKTAKKARVSSVLEEAQTVHKVAQELGRMVL